MFVSCSVAVTERVTLPVSVRVGVTRTVTVVVNDSDGESDMVRLRLDEACVVGEGLLGGVIVELCVALNDHESDSSREYVGDDVAESEGDNDTDKLPERLFDSMLVLLGDIDFVTDWLAVTEAAAFDGLVEAVSEPVDDGADPVSTFVSDILLLRDTESAERV